MTLGKGIEHFTEGLSAVFRHYAAALKPGAPFVFTYHHNDPSAYVAVVVAILDAGLDCTATLPAAAEMSASLHILGTKSSVLDSIFVCRHVNTAPLAHADVRKLLEQDAALMAAAEVKVSQGDIRCLASGHIARVAINGLSGGWDSGAALSNRMRRAEGRLVELARDLDLDSLTRRVLESLAHDRGSDEEERCHAHLRLLRQICKTALRSWSIRPSPIFSPSFWSCRGVIISLSILRVSDRI